MRNRAETKDGRGRMSDFKCKGLHMDVPPSRFYGEVSGECDKHPTHEA